MKVFRQITQALSKTHSSEQNKDTSSTQAPRVRQLSTSSSGNLATEAMDARTSRAIDNKTDPPRVLLSTSFTGTVPEGTVLSTSFTGTVPEGTVLSTSFTIPEDAQSRRSSNASEETDSSSFISEDTQSRRSSNASGETRSSTSGSIHDARITLSFLEPLAEDSSKAGSNSAKILLSAWDDGSEIFNLSDVKQKAGKSPDPEALQKCLELLLTMETFKILTKPAFQHIIEDPSVRNAVKHSWTGKPQEWSLKTLATISTTTGNKSLVEDTVNTLKELLETHNPGENSATSFLLPTSKAGERVKAKDFGEIDDFIIQHKNKTITYVPMDQRVVDPNREPYPSIPLSARAREKKGYDAMIDPPAPNIYQDMPEAKLETQPLAGSSETAPPPSPRGLLQRIIRRIMR